ncbi:hypothetical protein PSTT_10740 [Puccinia striiformis]|uniref:Secreted protein n=1 Tax=Puccinia striiformis TaxID=27350 RepID=A0A2S4V322_9BASI|nr:hypothetical protein PSTT_10740 [Puccinia striiformis]
MVSVAYLVTLLSVLVALSRAEEASSAKPEEVEDKFFFEQLEPSVLRQGQRGSAKRSRRAISLDADQLVRRADTESVTCIAAKGVSHEFSVKDCVAASRQLAEKKTSSATVGQCTLSLVNDKEKIAPASVSAHTLEKTARQVLKSCTNSVSEKEANANDKQTLNIDSKQVVMLISKRHECFRTDLAQM